jgi:hypothetical protein
MNYVYDSVRFLHVLTVVFMSVPLYNLIVVNERAAFGKAPFAVDRYFENIIKGAALRCFVYQLTALVTGLLLLPLSGLGWASLFTNPVLLAKLVGLLTLTSLLSVVHFRIQPAIEALLVQVEGESIPPEIAGQLAPLRVRRKRLAAVCLFLIITVVLLGIQVYQPFGIPLSAVILGLAALFAWRVYKTPVRFGWI